MKRMALLGVIVAAVLFVFTLLSRRFWPLERAPLVISPGTTHITEPLHPDGTVNYVAAIAAKFGQQPSSSNAAIPILRALGPDYLESTMRGEVLADLGLQDLEAAAGSHGFFVELHDHITQEASDDGDVSLDVARRLVGRAFERPFRAEDIPEIVGWIERNRPALKQLVVASLNQRYFIPLHSVSSPARIAELDAQPSIVRLRRAAQALAIFALWWAGEGDHRRAWEHIAALERLGGLLAEGWRLRTTVAGIGIQLDGACRAARTILENTELHAEAASNALGLLSTRPSSVSPSMAFEAGRWALLDFFQSCWARGQRPSLGDDQQALEGEFVDPAAFVLINEKFDEIGAIFDETAFAARLARARSLQSTLDRELEEVERERQESARDVFASPERLRLLGTRRDILRALALQTSQLPSLVYLGIRVEAEIELIRTALRLEVERSTTGVYPDEIPKVYVAAVMEVARGIDPFTGESLVYRPEGKGYVLLSVGADGRVGSDGDDPYGRDLRIEKKR